MPHAGLYAGLGTCAPGYAGAQGTVHADAPYDPAYDAPPRKTTPHHSAYAGQNAAAHPPSKHSTAAPAGGDRPAVEEFLTPTPRDPVARLKGGARDCPAAPGLSAWNSGVTSPPCSSATAPTARWPPALFTRQPSWRPPWHRMDQLRALRRCGGRTPAIAELAVSPLPVSSAEHLPNFVARQRPFEQQIARQNPT